MMPPSPVSRDQLHKRIESLQQQNRVLNVELETYKLRVKSLQEENKALRQASVHIQAKAEQEEEFISNTLLKKIQALKKEKESLALNYEQEEECLVNKLMRKIEKLETETNGKQNTLDQLRREKVELENTLEQEQEALVNKLWKRMDKLETEKRGLQIKLDQPVSEPPSPRDVHTRNGDTAATLANNIHQLRQECARLKQQLSVEELDHQRKMSEFEKEEKHIREENLRLQRKLQLEMERREALCRHLSESESSLEMEEERVVNEMMFSGGGVPSLSSRARTVSSPIPGPYTGGQPPSPSPTLSRPLSPGLNFGERRESSGPLPSAAVDSFTPPAALARFHSALPQGSFLPSPAPLGGPRSLPPRPPPQDQGHTPSSHLEKRFARPGAPITVCTSPASASNSSSTPLVSPNNMKEVPPASPMDTNLL